MYAIVAISSDGVELALKLQAAFPGSIIYTLPAFAVSGMQAISGSLGEFTGELFAKHKTVVFIMAVGIVVRCIAPHIRHKLTDPAVVAIDERGKFIISLLSGHWGGANQATEIIAGAIGAIPVITTASDSKGLVSVDMLAKRNGLIIHDLNEAKRVTAMMVNGQKVVVVNKTLYDIHSPADEVKEADAWVLITHTTEHVPDKPAARLLTPNIIVGIGCKRGTEGNKIFDLITGKLKECHIDKRCLRHIASVDLKANEPGILNASFLLGLKPVFISRDEIRKVEHLFTPSEFVRQATGVSGVCEPAAFIAGGCKGRFLLNKQSEDGVTVAFFESALKVELTT